MVAEELVGLAVRGAGCGSVNLRIYVAVGDEEIEATVVVVVEKARSPAQQLDCGRGEAGRGRDVGETHAALVAVERVRLGKKVGYVQVGIAILIVVAKVRAHARFDVAIAVVRHAGDEGDVLEGAVALVLEEHVRGLVVGDKEVAVAIGVVIGRHHAQAVIAIGGCHAGRLGDVGKRAIALVAVEHIRCAD